MADPRTFVLIGNFEDNITPALTKINDSINGFKRNMASMATKRGGGYGDVTKSIGKLISAHKNLTSSLKETQEQLKSTEGNLRSYRLEMAKAARAARMFEKSGLGMGSKQFANNMDAANRSAQAYLRTLEQIYAQSRRTPRGGYGGGGGYRPPRPPSGGYTGGGGSGMRPPTSSSKGSAGGGMSAHMAEFGFAFTLGNAIAQPIQNAVVSGFQIGVGFMMKPFEYFVNNLKERIEDEQSDIKAAGGIFSIARRQKDPFVKTMDEAMEFTQANNKHMAELADALPGNTQQYIEVSKRISDSISRIVMSDPSKAIERANQLREEEGKQELTGSSQAQTKGAITQLLGEMTKKTVLAGLGTGGGPGGVAGAYGLPQLTERMLTQDQVSMGQFQRYAAIFKDPLIMEALNRFIPKINASAAGTMERFEVMEKFYDEVLPKEMIRKFERSTAGILELFNTTIFGPETGLFGLGRKMEGMGKVMDDYGNYIKIHEDGTREVVDSLKKASDANLSLFDMLRDSFANLGISLYPILQNLGAIFDPLNKVSKLLVDFRHLSGRFLNSFEAYKNGFEDMVKAMGKDEKKEFLKIGLELRASLAAVNNFFLQKGIIGQGQFQETAKQLMSTSFDYKAMISGMVDTFLNSNAAGELGTLIGEIIGTVLKEVAKVTGFISGRIESSNKLFDGIKKGFNDAGGPEAIRNIFSDLFKSLFKLLIEVMKVIPAEGYMLMAAMTVIPAAIQGLGMLIAEKTLKGLGGLQGKLGELLTKTFARVQAQVPKNLDVVPVNVRDLSQEAASRITDPSRLLAPAKETALATTTKAGPLAKSMGAFGKFFTSFVNYVKGVGPRFMGFFKGFLGKLTIFGGVVTSIISLFQGKDLATALAEGAGPVLGAALGAALIPFLGPIGPMIGSAIGGWIGSMKAVTEPLASAISSVFGTLKTTFDLLIQIGSDIGGVLNVIAQKLFGVSKEFDVLRFAMEALLSPFRLLELMILGLYEGYLRMKEQFFGLDAQEKKAKNETFLLRMQKTAEAELAFKQAYNEKARAEYQKELNSLRARGQGDQERARIVESAIKTIDAKLKQKDPNYKPPTSPTSVTTATVSKPAATSPAPVKSPGGDPVQANLRAKALQDIQWFWKKLTTAPSQTGAKPDPYGPSAQKPPTTPVAAAAVKVPAEVQQTAQSTSQINQKAATQVVQAASIQKSTAETKTIAQTSGVTLGNIRAGVIAVSNKLSGIQSAILGDLNNIQAGVSSISSLLSSGNLKVKSDFNMPGGLPGGGSGGPAIFGAAAQKFGLQMTSGYRPGDPGYHGINRARDYSNGSGPTPQMMAFAQYLYSTFGSNLKELIYTPLGFSVKNGQKVPPYAQAAHYNHVHVAWAFGPQNGVGFDSQRKAENWERSMVPGSVKVASITSNSAEGLGSTSVGDIYVTVNAGATNDPDQLAYMVAERIQTAVSDAVNANILV